MTYETNRVDLNAVAVIGIAGRFPGADNTRQFWENLCSGKESIRFFSDDELDPGIEGELKHDPNYIKARGVLAEAESVDAAFFGISPREAAIMDPQQRVFLETSWEALEDAGYAPESFEGLIGVFAGSGFNTYFINHVLADKKIYRSVGEHQVMFANAPDYLSTRVSYKLNLKGPSISLYTGCSTSLVAVSCAFDSLLSFQCDIAIAGGVHVYCPQNSGYQYQSGEIYSSDGRCRPFDAGATGTVFSNGSGAVVLKRLEDALKDRDSIYAVIKGSALNNDGANKMSFAAPSIEGQAEAIAMAMANADVHPETIAYVEAHGTGTIIGDPIEIEALNLAFRSKTQKKGFCAIGSLKGNVGHLDAAAGIAGLIKVCLALKHGVIPPSINFENPNPEIDFDNSPFYVNTNLKRWPKGNGPRRAGLSSLGVGGTNSHVILEEAPENNKSGPSRPMQLLPVSARTQTALTALTENLRRHIQESPSDTLADIAYTLKTGRKAFACRRFVVCENPDDAVQALEKPPQQVWPGRSVSAAPELVFMFPGQGAQYVNMGLSFYRHEAVFRREVNRCAEVLKDHLALDIREILYPEPSDEKEAQSRLRQTGIQQPALFTIEYALARLWESWGVGPSAMIGHSIGEYVAACLAGVFTLEGALMLVAVRGRMMQDLPGGSMLTVRLPAEEVASRLDDNLSLAAVNSPSLCVVSGMSDAVEALQKDLENEGVACRLLHTSHAFHSPMMDEIVGPFTEKVRTVWLSEPAIPFVSTATGTWIRPEEAADPAYWGRQLRLPVRFAKGISTLWEEKPERILLEVGPRATSVTMARQQAKDPKKQTAIASMGDSADDNGEWRAVLNALGHLWVCGTPVNWAVFYGAEDRCRLPLPSYPFERTRYWVEKISQDQDRHFAGKEAANAENMIQSPQAGALHAEHITPDPISKTVSALNNPERQVAAIWKDLLGVKEVARDDNFFDLGGDSLLAAGLLARIEKKFNKKIPPEFLYEAPTLEKLAGFLSGADSVSRIKDSETSGSYTIIIAGPSQYKQEILELWKKNFSNLTVKRFPWLYEENPAGPPACLFVKDTKQNAIVGVQALFPRRIYVRGKPYRAALGGDLVVNKEHRVLAPALLLQRAVFDHCNGDAFDFFYGFPNDKSQSINQILGLQMFDLVRMTKPLKSYYYLKRYLGGEKLSRVLSIPVDRIRSLLRDAPLKKRNGFTAEILSSFDDKADALWEKAMASYPIIGERSSTYLNWRYFGSPHYDHRVFALFDSFGRDMAGYIVFHTIEKKTNVDDMLCVDMNGTFDVLMAEFMRFQRKENIDSVSVSYSGNSLLVKKFSQLGFSIRDKANKITVYAPSKADISVFVKEKENWHLMPGDNDI